VRRLTAGCIVALWLAQAGVGYATTASLAIDLTTLSLEELMGVEVTLASRKKEKLFETAAAVFVLTREDIRRSGVTNKWAISARGFNGRFAQKLLVQIDGRSVYTPLFSGVFWEVQDVLWEDVARIEVIRGPGATLWGANAVNGIINIITRTAQESRGGWAAVGGGSEERAFGQVRYGDSGGDGVDYRVYGKYFARDAGVNLQGGRGADAWNMGRGGSRADWAQIKQGELTLQGDVYRGETGQRYRFAIGESPYQRVFDDDTRLAGGNVLGRWRRALSSTSEMAVQLYYDRSEWEDEMMREIRDTYDADFQHRFALGARQEVVWGWGYRQTRDQTQKGMVQIRVTPAKRNGLLVPIERRATNSSLSEANKPCPHLLLLSTL
jgi:iron complex outermembrane receptor protein